MGRAGMPTFPLAEPCPSSAPSCRAGVAARAGGREGGEGHCATLTTAHTHPQGLAGSSVAGAEPAEQTYRE